MCVFMEQKRCLRYFNIQGTYFKIGALYFFFSRMWVLCGENLFSLFVFQNSCFFVFGLHWFFVRIRDSRSCRISSRIIVKVA